ncbi:TIGR03086 family metal-binding protein [Micromonospora sp. NPDC049559]|uniref:TIGR03086 family metal-binding protein n=1 Tax=Micromonospora sp. NPDC049559 TaxID=3155923 RepID=UPI003422A933
MTTKISQFLATAAAPARAVVRGIRDDQLALPTPCAEYAVRDLLNHLFHVVVQFQGLASRQPADFVTTPDYLDGDWRGRFATETGRLAEAWSDPSALDGVSPGMGMPQETVGNMALVDLTVHAWELARATGQPYEPDPAVVSALYEPMERLLPQGRRFGVFADPVPVPAEATEFDRLLGLTGRDPAWTAPGR